MRTVVNSILIIGLLLPGFVLAQEETPSQMPGTMEEAKTFSLTILEGLPGAIKKVWQEEALPFWMKFWDWLRGLIDPWWQKFLNFLGEKKPEVEQEFQKEKQEMKEDLPQTIETGKSLWQRFKEFFE